MATQKLASLIVDLDAKIVKLEAGFKKATQRTRSYQRDNKKILGKVEKQFRRVGKSVIAFAAAFVSIRAVKGIADVSEASLRMSNALAKSAQVGGIATKTLQELRFAGEKTGSTILQVDDAMRRFNRRLGLARTTGGAYLEVLKKMGVVASDTTEQALEKFLVGLANIENQSERTAAATTLFGDDAAKLTNIVGKGTKGLTAMREEANELGLVLSTGVTERAERATDVLDILAGNLRNKLAIAVDKNLTGLLQFKILMNDIQLAVVGAAGAVGNFAAKIDAGIDRGLRNRKAAAVQQLIAQQDKIRALAVGEGVRTPRPAQDAQRAAVLADARNEAKALTRRINNIQREIKARKIAKTEQDKLLSGGVPSTIAPSGGGGDAGSKFDEVSGAALKVKEEQAAKVAERTQRQLDRNKEAQDRLTAATDKYNDQLINTADNVRFVFSDAARDLLNGRLGDAIKGLTGRLKGMLVELLIIQPIMRALFGAAGTGFGGSIGGLFGSVFGGARAGGGPVSPNKSFLVGENGPELFSPGVAGRITPNGGGAGAMTLNLHFDVGLESVENKIRELTPPIAVAVQRAVASASQKPRFL